MLIGNVSRTVTKTEPPPRRRCSASRRPPPQVTTEEYRYAKLKDNDLVFELRTDKLADLFADPQELRDPSLARFETGDVTELTVAVKGKPPVKITRKKGNKDAEKDEDRQDRWYVGDLLAEASKVTELLDQLAPAGGPRPGGPHRQPGRRQAQGTGDRPRRRDEGDGDRPAAGRRGRHARRRRGRSRS